MQILSLNLHKYQHILRFMADFIEVLSFQFGEIATMASPSHGSQQIVGLVLWCLPAQSHSPSHNAELLSSMVGFIRYLHQKEFYGLLWPPMLPSQLAHMQYLSS